MDGFPRNCTICGTRILDKEQFHRHTRMASHIRARESMARREDARRDAEAKNLHDKLELASALEGHSLFPGDEVTTREGRAFKVDIYGKLFEVPCGSVG